MKTFEEKPDCSKCIFRQNIPGDCHSRCTKNDANFIGGTHEIFDPGWLIYCDSFVSIEKIKTQVNELMGN